MVANSEYLGPLTLRLLQLTNLRRPKDELKVKIVIFQVALFRLHKAVLASS